MCGVFGWSIVVPVKRLAVAKTRLRGATEEWPPGPERPRAGSADHGALVLAMATDTVAAALACPAVTGVVVVTDEPAAAEELTALGALCVPDRPDAGLNPALAYGGEVARRRDPAGAVAVLGSDLPALRPGELAAALLAAERHERAYLPDAAGGGTTLLTARRDELAPAFGAGSAGAHERSGAVRLDGDWPSLRRDVDTPADLAAAAALGLGPRTSSLLSHLAGSAGAGRSR
jgi:2-phospho-L-lactate guanylyltransferase